MTSSSTTEVRVDRLIAEVPSYWQERKFGKSRFRISEWFFDYMRWYLYGLETFWFRKSPSSVKLKNL